MKRRDVNDIWDYIANDSIEVADRVLDALESALVKLCEESGCWSLARIANGQKATLLSSLFVPDRLSARSQAL